MNYFIKSLILFYSVTGLAGGRVGNGGDGVVCRDINKNISSIELLDFYEARVLRNIELEMGPNTLNHMQKIEYVLNRLSKVDSYRAYKYGTVIKGFHSEALFKKGISLTDINDSGHLALPQNCLIEQVVIQQDVRFPEDKKFLVNQDLWDAMDENSKAGLILHETIYTEALFIGHEDSVRTRYLNSVLTSNRLNKPTTAKEVYELLERVGFSRFGFRDLKVWASSTADKFYSNGTLKSADVYGTATGAPFLWKNQPILANGHEQGSVEYFENGNLKSVNIHVDIKLKNKINTGEVLEVSSGKINFWDNGELSGAFSLVGPLVDSKDSFKKSVKVSIQNTPVYLYAGNDYFRISGYTVTNEVSFWENQSLRKINMVEPAKLRLANGIEMEGFFSELSRDGLVITGQVSSKRSFPLTNSKSLNILPGTFSLYENGDLKSAVLEEIPNWPLNSLKATSVRGIVTFWPKGIPKSIVLARYLNWKVQDKEVVLTKWVDFYQDGKLFRGYTPYTTMLSSRDGIKHEIKGQFCLDQDGYYLDNNCSK